jgi:hypothetical protein
MKEDETIKEEQIRELVDRYFNTLKPKEETEFGVAQIRMEGYCELSYTIFNLVKLCILALDQEAPRISRTIKSSSVDVGVVLKIVAQLLPRDEIEFLDEINDMLMEDQEQYYKMSKIASGF